MVPKVARRQAARALAAMRVPYGLFAGSRSRCELILAYTQREAASGRETPMAYLNVAGVITRFKRSYISAVRRVAVPGSKSAARSQNCPKTNSHFKCP